MELTQAKRLFFLTLITSLSVTGALAIFFLLFAELDETTGRIVLTTTLIGLFSLLALPAGVLLDQRRYFLLAGAVIALAAVAFVLAMVLTWRSWEDEGDESVWKAFWIVGTFAGASSQAAMTTSRRRPEDPAYVLWLYLGSLVLAGVLAVMVTIATLEEIDDEWFYRALGAVAVADVLLVIVQSVARRLALVAPAHRVVFTLDRAPSDDAVAAARRALEEAGARVERVDAGR